MLQEHFQQLLKGYTNDVQLVNQFWTEISMRYANKKRYYHSLSHLAHVLEELQNCRTLINDWDTVLFSLFYHDIIYNPLRQDNEEKSAAFAVKRLKVLSYPSVKTANCYAQILSTKGHQISEDADTNFFTDADLSILGSGEETYTQYAANIRKEYALYPDFLYKKGRKKVLQYFLQMDRIYKTTYFHEQFEEAARKNMIRELQQL